MLGRSVKVRTSSGLYYSERNIQVSGWYGLFFSGCRLDFISLQECWFLLPFFTPILSLLQFPTLILSTLPSCAVNGDQTQRLNPCIYPSIHPSVSTASIETKHLLQPLWEAARSGVLKKFKSSLISFSLPLQTENEGERERFSKSSGVQGHGNLLWESLFSMRTLKHAGSFFTEGIKVLFPFR